MRMVQTNQRGLTPSAPTVRLPSRFTGYPWREVREFSLQSQAAMFLLRIPDLGLFFQFPLCSARRHFAPLPHQNACVDRTESCVLAEEEKAAYLGGFCLPIHKRQKVAGQSSAWDFVKDDPQLPRVLLIGDSVSRGYTPSVRKSLAGEANVHLAPANCGPTSLGLNKIDV